MAAKFVAGIGVVNFSLWAIILCAVEIDIPLAAKQFFNTNNTNVSDSETINPLAHFLTEEQSSLALNNTDEAFRVKLDIWLLFFIPISFVVFSIIYEFKSRAFEDIPDEFKVYVFLGRTLLFSVFLSLQIFVLYILSQN